MAATSNAAQFMQAPGAFQEDFEAFHATHFSGDTVEAFDSDFFQVYLSQGDDQYYDEQYDDYFEEEDDGLGYYPDGVKRTLTDEQIAIFRHSELEALRRAESKCDEVGKSLKDSAADPLSGTMVGSLIPSPPTDIDESDEGLMKQAANEVGRTPPNSRGQLAQNDYTPQGSDSEEEGELEPDKPDLKPSNAATKKKKKKKKKKNNNNNKRNKTKGSKAHDPQNPQPGEQGWFKNTIKPDLRKRTWDVVDAGMDSLDYDEMEAVASNGVGPATQRRKIFYDD